MDPEEMERPTSEQNLSTQKPAQELSSESEVQTQPVQRDGFQLPDWFLARNTSTPKDLEKTNPRIEIIQDGSRDKDGIAKSGETTQSSSLLTQDIELFMYQLSDELFSDIRDITAAALT